MHKLIPREVYVLRGMNLCLSSKLHVMGFRDAARSTFHTCNPEMDCLYRTRSVPVSRLHILRTVYVLKGKAE